jgi:hypothetical protein
MPVHGQREYWVGARPRIAVSHALDASHLGRATVETKSQSIRIGRFGATRPARDRREDLKLRSSSRRPFSRWPQPCVRRVALTSAGFTVATTGDRVDRLNVSDVRAAHPAMAMPGVEARPGGAPPGSARRSGPRWTLGSRREYGHFTTLNSMYMNTPDVVRIPLQPTQPRDLGPLGSRLHARVLADGHPRPGGQTDLRVRRRTLRGLRHALPGRPSSRRSRLGVLTSDPIGVTRRSHRP